jgi:hypothetical protein
MKYDFTEFDGQSFNWNMKRFSVWSLFFINMNISLNDSNLYGFIMNLGLHNSCYFHTFWSTCSTWSRDFLCYNFFENRPYHVYANSIFLLLMNFIRYSSKPFKQGENNDLNYLFNSTMWKNCLYELIGVAFRNEEFPGKEKLNRKLKTVSSTGFIYNGCIYCVETYLLCLRTGGKKDICQ